MAYIVHGATGAQGAPVLSALVAAGADAVGAARNPDAIPDGRGVRVDLGDADALTRLYAGSDGVFVHLPLAAPDVLAAQAVAIATAIARATPTRVVISTSGQVVDEPGSPLQSAPDSPVMTLITAARSSSVPTAVLAPRLFLENLLLPVVREPLLREDVLRYPLPAGCRVSWASQPDAAQVAALLLTGEEHSGVVGVGALPGLTGQDLADAFCEALGRPIRFEPITPHQFGALLRPVIGSAAEGVAALYTRLAAAAGSVILRETSAQTLLGIEPRPVAQWAAGQSLS
ncbi:MAG: NAD(P)H-binding protein [Actinomycetia bacterium]|nr:NAD(P)H-binding protein [Actinomycetes bacterium]